MSQVYFSRQEAAQELGCHVETVSRWIRRGDLQAERSPTGVIMIPKAEIERVRPFLAEVSDNRRKTDGE